MKYDTLMLCVCSLVLAACLLAAGCTSSTPVPPVTPVPTPVPPSAAVTTSAQPACGLTSCHGLDLACGRDVPQVCTMEYAPGDRCRQYAQCTSGSDGSCTLVTSPQFNSCKTCAQKCELRAGADNLAAASCEEQC
jgi:hypothetical protein